MEDVRLAYFPFPHLVRGERLEGLRGRWPRRCDSCDRQCERSRERRLQLCSYGVNFFPFDKEFLVFGVVVADLPVESQARRKMLRVVKGQVTAAEVAAAYRRYEAVKDQDARDIQARKDGIVDEYQKSERYKEDLVGLLKPEMKKMLAQIHDYRQFVAQVVQNVNVLLQKRMLGRDIEEQLAAAPHEEVAIYWAARLMEEKIETALFLLEPERIDDPRQRRRFRFHGCVTKYLKIYQRSMERKGLKVEVVGESFGDVVGNPKAIAVIPHTLLDNALKYAPRGSSVRVSFHEDDDTIVLTVGSLGPRIEVHEREKIFDLFYRGERAQVLEPDGSGFGLHLAQLVATKYGTRIGMKQEPKAEKGELRWTEFSVGLPLA